MLQFEALLLKELQRQQSRAEFCDTVLQSQGVSVPVHGCVLSAFSPWLCGVLSSTPAPLPGQRRLIELQCVEACALLSLVSLLYSGQLDGNRGDVLSAAESLGIKLPHQNEESLGGKEERRKGGADTEQSVEGYHNVNGKDEQKKRESGTQTVFERVRDERETQTDHICSDLQQYVHLNGCATCQEQGTHTSACLQGGLVAPGQTSSSCDVLPVPPQTGACHVVSEPACVYQFSMYPSEPSYLQTPSSVTVHPSASGSTCMELGHALSTGGGVDDTVEGYEQFESNIPGFISYFLDSTHSQGTKRRGRGRPRGRGRGRARGEGAVRKARVRSRGEGTVRGGGGRGRGRGGPGPNYTERWGWAPMLTGRGQGGGRVGRKLDIGTTGGQPVKLARRRRGRRALLEVGAGRGRGRQRQRGSGGRLAGREGQDAAPCMSSLQGPPHAGTLPLPPCSSSLLHTVSLPPAPQESTQPTEIFLDDIIAGLNFQPIVNIEAQTNQHGFVITEAPDIPSVPQSLYPCIDSSVKSTDGSQQQPEGEDCDILDHFLNMFEQHVHDSDLEEQPSDNQPLHHTRSGGAQQNKGPSVDSGSNTYTQLQTLKPHSPQANVSPHCTRASTALTPNTQPQAIKASPSNISLPQNQLGWLSAPWRRESKEKFEDVEKEVATQQMTRSKKRKLGTTSPSLQTPPSKKRLREKQASVQTALTDKEMPQVRRISRRRKHVRRCRVHRHLCESAVSDCKGSKNRTSLTRPTKGLERSRSNKKHLKTRAGEKRRRANAHGEGYDVETKLVAPSSWTSQAPVKKTTGGSYIAMASSAFEKMRMLLEKQRQRTQLKDEKSAKMKVQEGGAGTEGELPPGSTSHSRKNRAVRTEGSAVEAEDGKRTVCPENEAQEEASGTGEARCNQENNQSLAAGLEQVKSNKCSSPSQEDLLPNADSIRSTQKGEEEECNNNEPVLITAESHQITSGLCLSDPVSTKDVLYLPHGHQDQTSSDKDVMNSMTDSGERTPTTLLDKLTFLSHSPPRRELLPSLGEDEDVDVLEVSSSASEPIDVPPVLLRLSTEEEEEDTDEDVDVDVLGVNSD